MSIEDFGAMSDEDLDARIAASREIPDEAEPVDDTPEPDPAPQGEPPPPEEPAPVAEPAQGVEQVPDPERNRGDLNVALQQERERGRQARDAQAQLEALLNNPQALAQYAAQRGYQLAPPPQPQQQEIPDRDLDPAGYADYRIAEQNERFAALEQRAQQADQRADQLSQEAELRKQWPDLDQRLASFDQELPGLAAKYNPAEKYLMTLGSQMADPVARKALIEVEARQMAEGMVAEALAKQKTPLPTVNGVARAGSVNPGAPVAKHPSQMTDAEVDEASAAARKQFINRR